MSLKKNKKYNICFFSVLTALLQISSDILVQLTDLCSTTMGIKIKKEFLFSYINCILNVNDINIPGYLMKMTYLALLGLFVLLDS